MKGAATDCLNSILLGMVVDQCWTCFILRSLEGNVKSIALVYVIYRHKREQYIPEWAEGLMLLCPLFCLKLRSGQVRWLSK